MRRRSYYPHNQQIISTVTATSSPGVAAPRIMMGTSFVHLIFMFTDEAICSVTD